MKKLLSELSAISKQKILLEPDVIIFSKLVNFENLIPDQSKITDEIFEKIEAVLIQLLYSNNSQLSFHCAIRIAQCLLLLYQNERKIKIWNLITAFNKKPDLPIIYATGHVLKKRGKYSKSVVSGVAKTLFSINEKFIFGQIFALTSCFKSSPQDMKNFFEKSFSLIKKFLLIPNEPLQLQCLKLAIQMIKNGQLHQDKFIPLISTLLQDQNMPFIIDESCYLIALLAFSQLRLKSPETEETSKKSTKDDLNQLSKAFSIIETFKKFFDNIFARFLSLLTPEFINANSLNLFNIVRRIDVSQMLDLISFFGIDVRRDLFTQLSKESISLDQIKVMTFLAFDSKSLSDTAQLALEVVTRPNLRERMKSALFFSNFVQRDPQTATQFLKKASKFLANPPSDSKTLENDFQGLSTIVATILTHAPNREQLIERVDEHVHQFLEEAYKCDNCLSPYYIPAFTLMTALPRHFYDKSKVDKLLSYFPSFLRSYQTNDNERKQAVQISQSLSLFLSVHQEFEQAVNTIDLISSTDYLFTDFNQLCIFLAYPHLDGNSVSMAKLGTKLKSIVKKGKANQDFIYSIIENPFITRTVYLNNNPEFEIPQLYQYFNSSSSKEIMYRTYATFPDFIASLPSSSKPIWIQWIVVDCMSNTNAHCLIYSLMNDNRTQKLLPANLHEVMLSVISTFDQISQIQMAAEIIAGWAKLFPKILNPLLEKLSEKRDKAKCFILAALFSHVQMTDDMIMNQIIELNNLAKIDDELCPYVLFALSSLFLSYSVQLAAMPFTDSQANFLLSLLCTDKTLDSFTLYHITRAFNALLPIISPDIEKSRPMAIPILTMIIQLIAFDPLPFSKQIFFHMMHSIFSFIRQLGDIVTLEFPKSKSANLSCKIEACQALADMLILNNLEVDFMNLIPQVLMLLQRTNHNNPNMFIIAVAANFASTSDPTSPLCREQIMKWTQLVKLCISSGTIPTVGNVKIAASDKVKICMLNVIKELIPLVLKTSPMLNEALDDIMTSLTRAVETKTAELQKIAYPQLLKIVADFGSFKGENDQPIISLYDIQFASAVKIGFYNLDISGNFVIAFLNFHISNMNVLHDEFISILDYFVSCFKECKHKTWHYYSVTSRIVEIAMNNEEIYEKIAGFLSRFIKDYAKIIIKAGDLWTEEPPNMIAISLFKAEYSSFYPSMIKSFIWIQSFEVEEKIIKPKQLLTFFLSELDIEHNESYRIDGAFQGLTALLQYESDSINNKRLVKIINAVNSTYDSYGDLIKPSLRQFLISASEKLESHNENSWQQLVSILVDDNFDSLVLCYLIKNGAPETISRYAINFVELIYDCYKHEKCDLEKSIALCTMLFYIADDRFLDLLEFVLSIKGRKSNVRDFKFAYLSQLFKFIPSKTKKIINEFGPKLSKLIWTYFENGGQKFLVQLICENKKIAKCVLVSDEFNDYSISIIDDVQALNSLLDLFRFILLNFEYLLSDGDFLNCVIMFLLRLIIQWGDDNTKSTIVFQCAQILKMIAKNSSLLIRVAYKEMGEEFQQSAISYIRKFVKAQKNKGKGANIRLFSKSKTSRRQRKADDGDDFDDDGDWQDLTVE